MSAVVAWPDQVRRQGMGACRAPGPLLVRFGAFQVADEARVAVGVIGRAAWLPCERISPERSPRARVQQLVIADHESKMVGWGGRRR